MKRAIFCVCALVAALGASGHDNQIYKKGYENSKDVVISSYGGYKSKYKTCVRKYGEGRFKSPNDGCNSCACGQAGTLICTQKRCKRKKSSSSNSNTRNKNSDIIVDVDDVEETDPSTADENDLVVDMDEDSSSKQRPEYYNLVVDLDDNTAAFEISDSTSYQSADTSGEEKPSNPKQSPFAVHIQNSYGNSYKRPNYGAYDASYQPIHSFYQHSRKPIHSSYGVAY